MCNNPRSNIPTERRLQPALLAVLLGLCLSLPGAAQGNAEEAKTKAQARVAAAERMRDEGAALRQHADFSAAAAADANLDSGWQRGEQLLQTARNAILEADAAPSAGAYRDAGILANGARRTFEEFKSRTTRELRRIEARRAPPPAAEPPPPVDEPPVDEPSTTTEPSGTETTTSSPDDTGPTTASAKPETSGTEAATVGTADDMPAAAPPRRTAARPPPSASTLPPLTSAAPPLRRAIEAFFKGDDAAVLDALAKPKDLGSGQHKAHGLMLRAASRYHLYLLGGEQDHAQRSAAVEDVLASRRLNASLEPSRELFSPRFVDFFHGVQMTPRP